MKRTLEGVYTVEAALVFSICFLIIGGAICLSFTIYNEARDYVMSVDVENYDPVERFRLISAGKYLLLGD